MGWLRLMDGRRRYLVRNARGVPGEDDSSPVTGSGGRPRFSETHESPGPTLMRNRLEGGKLGVESRHSAGVLVLIEVSG